MSLPASDSLHIGIFGGSFDPLHNGHIAIAREAKDGLNLNRVIFVPAYCPPHKQRPILAPFEHRLEMIRRAISDSPCFELSDIERQSACPSYAGDTIRQLKQICGERHTYYFIIGLDSLLTLTTPEKSRIHPGLCYLICLTRPGVEQQEIVLKLSEAFKPYVIFRDADPGAVSSTEIKKRIRGDLSVENMVPDPVYEYITQFRIYTTCLT